MKITNGYRVKNMDVMKLTSLVCNKFVDLKKDLLNSSLNDILIEESKIVRNYYENFIKSYSLNNSYENYLENMIKYQHKKYLKNKDKVETLFYLNFSLVVFIKNEYIYILVYTESPHFLSEFKKLIDIEEFFYYDDESGLYDDNYEIWNEFLSRGPNDFPCNNGLIIEPQINYFQCIDSFFMNYLKEFKNNNILKNGQNYVN